MGDPSIAGSAFINHALQKARACNGYKRANLAAAHVRRPSVFITNPPFDTRAIACARVAHIWLAPHEHITMKKCLCGNDFSRS